MIKLNSPLGEVYLRPTEILAVMPERGRPGCSLIYTVLFPDGLSVDMGADKIVEIIMSSEYYLEECEIEIEDDEEE